MHCSECSREMEAGYLYVRGFGVALLWSSSPAVSAVSSQGVAQIDLRSIGAAPSRLQAIVPAFRCPECYDVRFKTKRMTMPFIAVPRSGGTASMEATETR
jgi:hypothetical protein